MADMSLIEKNGAHANEAVIFNNTTMQNNAVPDGHIVANQSTRIAKTHMHYGAILNRTIFTNFDQSHITPQNSSRPNARPFLDNHLPYYVGSSMNEGSW